MKAPTSNQNGNRWVELTAAEMFQGLIIVQGNQKSRGKMGVGQTVVCQVVGMFHLPTSAT